MLKHRKERKMSKILAVTGATGAKSGSAFAQRLVDNKKIISELFPDGVRLLVRIPEKLKDLDKKIYKSTVCVGNINDEKYLSTSLNDVDTVVHIAGIHTSPFIVRAAIKCNIRRLILVHTTGIYSKYKEAGEEYRKIDDSIYMACKEHNIILTILRPTMIYGNTSDDNIVQFIKMVDKFPIMPVVNGARYKLQPVHYDDLAEAYYKVLVNEKNTANKDFNLSGGEPIELKEMLSVISKNLGKKIRFISLPFPIAYAGAWVLYVITMKKIDYREKVQRLCEPRVFSYEAAKEAFGYAPRSFQSGVVNEVKEYKQNRM
jgi:nucleoside-diphosphate-sugar epimerase